MAGSGAQAEQSLHESMAANRGKYLLVIEGAIPKAQNGIFCKVGGKTAMELLREAAPGAAAVLCIGTCSSFGGIQSVGVNPTGAVGVRDLVTDKPIVNIPGCPPNPYNFLSTVLHYLTFKRLPELDALGRPKFAYGRKIHEHCERRPHFDAGRFAQAYGDAGHAQGYCLYKLGCKGPGYLCQLLRPALQRRGGMARLDRASLHRLHRAGHPLQAAHCREGPDSRPDALRQLCPGQSEGEGQRARPADHGRGGAGSRRSHRGRHHAGQETAQQQPLLRQEKPIDHEPAE